MDEPFGLGSETDSSYKNVEQERVEEGLTPEVKI